MSSSAAATWEGQGNMLRSSECRFVYDFLFDSHCHLRRISASAPAAAVPDPVTRVSGAGGQCNYKPCDVTGLVLCGTHPSIDWDAIAQASATRAATLIGFGVHPWFVPNTASSPQEVESDRVAEGSSTSSPSPVHPSSEACCGSAATNANLAAPRDVAPTLPTILRLLGERLQQDPFAIVAEIGLDKLRGPPESVQVEAFAAQLRLAAAYRRPVSVHCVRHYGLLLQVLQNLPAEHTPPAIILHAFTGSLEIAKSLLSLKNKKGTFSTDGAATPAQDAPAAADSALPARTRTKRGGATADIVRIKDLIFFGVGVSTSFAVKGFATLTLPFLLDARRVLLETDEHYSGIEEQAAVSACEFPAGVETQLSARSRSSTRVRVDPREHVKKLAGVMERIHATMSGSREFVKKAEASNVSVEAVLRDALLHARSAAFCSVLGETGTL